jgi:cephalosporin hydroxylase
MERNIIEEAYVKYWPQQIQIELIGLINLLKENPPKIICEIGLGHAGTFYVLSQYFPEAKLISITLPKFIDGDGNKIDDGDLGGLIKTFGKDIVYIPGDSRSPAIVNKLKEVLGGKTIDFLLIDGEHDYNSVKSDFENYGALTKGIVAFHDICPPVQSSPIPVNYMCEVHIYWNEIKNNYKYRELIRSPGHQCFQGLGVIWK